MAKDNSLKTIGTIFIIIMGFIFCGVGLSILYNSKGDIVSVVGGFALIGIAVAIIYKIIQDG